MAGTVQAWRRKIWWLLGGVALLGMLLTLVMWVIDNGLDEKSDAAIPEAELPAVTVTAHFEGSDPATMEQFVVAPIEHGLQALPDLDHITSESTYGKAVVQVYFKPSVSAREARWVVQDRMDDFILRNMPMDVTYEVIVAQLR